MSVPRANVSRGRVEDGRGSLGHSATLRFPSPLIEPDVPISGIRLSDWFHREVHGEQTNRTRLRYGEYLSFAPRHSNLRRRLSLMVFAGSSPITTTSPSSKAHQKSGSFPQPALPGFNGHTTPSDSRHGRRLSRRRGRYPRPWRVSPDYPNHLSNVPCPLPRRIERVRVSIASPLTRPSPNGRRVCIRIVTFEACSGFTHVTARRIAQPPKATFVTRLQPFRLPGRAARQLPDQSTTLWVESSSTDDSRLRGALP